MRREIRLAGAGGHGVITAAIILAEAAAKAGYEVAQTQTYGPEARGGLAFADVVISDEPISYPKARRPDYLVALTQEAADAYSGFLPPGGVLLVDEGEVKASLPLALRLPILSSVRRDFKNETFAGLAAVGAVWSLWNFCPEGELEKAVAGRVPPKTLAVNLLVLKLGEKLGREAAAKPALPDTGADL